MSHLTVFAAHQPTYPPADIAFVSRSCTACTTDFRVQASLTSPFCPSCGNAESAALSAPETASTETNAEQFGPDAAAIVCATCDTGLVLSKGIETAGHVFCVCCGTDNEFAATTAAVAAEETAAGGEEETASDAAKIDPSVVVDADIDDNDEDGNPVVQLCAADGVEKATLEGALAELADIDDDDSFDDDDEDEEDLDDIPDIQTANILDTMGKEADGLDNPNGPEDLSQTQTAGVEVAAAEPVAVVVAEVDVGDPNDKTANSDGRDGNPATKDAAEDVKNRKEGNAAGDAIRKEHPNTKPDGKHASHDSGAQQKLSQTNVSPNGTDGALPNENRPSPVNLLDIVRADSKQAMVQFARLDDTILCYVGKITVAALEKDEVNASVRQHFDSQAYLDSIMSSVQLSGLYDTLSDYGFQALTVNATSEQLAALSNEKVESRVRAEIANVEKSGLDEVRACLGIASTGLTKNFFALTNPLREELCSVFTQAGLKNPQRMIDTAFASAADGYNAVLVEKAFDILQMPVLARNELSKAIGTANHVTARTIEEGSVTVAPEVSTSQPKTNTILASLKTPMQAARGETVTASTGGSAVARTVSELKAQGLSVF